MHQERRRKPALDDTAVSVSGARAAHSRKLEPSDRHSAFPERLSASSCNKRQQPHLKEGGKKKKRNRVVLRDSGKKVPPPYLRVSVEEITCPAASVALFWRLSALQRLPLCVCQRHVIITEEDCALLCATSGLLEGANERSWCWRRGRSALWVMWSTCAAGQGRLPAPTDGAPGRFPVN